METIYKFKNSSSKLIEKIVDDDFSAINHVILSAGDSLPEHYSNSNTYFIIVQGTIALRLGEDNSKSYEAGSIVYIPYNIKMNVANGSGSILEFFIVKAPNPGNYKA
ncbi:MAG: cupin domain-containing protein [Spirochaetaceae bacterium]|nr:cupin domain-containing protein [Spirochaetaceae bacterium]